MSSPDPGAFTADLRTAELAMRCREESARTAGRRDPRFCLELFRRAIVGREAEAWDAIYAQYHALVRYWLSGAPDTYEDLVQETFGRFSQAVTAERFAAGEFPTLAGLLAFLRTVAINQRNNATRRIVRERRALDRWVQQEQLTGQADRSEQSVRRELADYVLSLVHDERERLVLHLTYEFDLPPREIVKRHPQYFENTAEVNRIKERLKKRLRSDLRLRRYLDET